MRRPALWLLIGLTLAGCTLAPAYRRPGPPIPAVWPDSATAQGGNASAADLPWRDVFIDPRLQGLIDLALRENRDLRVAVANIAKSRAQYGVQRASLLPSLNATAARSSSFTPASVSLLPSGYVLNEVSASVEFTNYEIDLFGRVRNQTEAARQAYLASAEDRRTAQVSLIAEVAADYVTLAADQDLLALDRAALTSREDSERLTRRMFAAGSVSALDVSQAQTLTEQTRSDAAQAATAVAQARDALRLVVGAEPPPALLPDGDLAAIGIRQDLPPGLPSQVLVRRPDVLSAEHALIAQNADIGAARAAFFPQISLTASGGSASTSLGKLFAPGSAAWSYAPQITLPLFAGGANVAGLRGAKAGRDIALAQYEKAIQNAFRDVADTLAARANLNDELTAQQRLVAAADLSRTLSKARFEHGVDSFLNLLDAERTLYGAQQGLLNTRLTELVNRINLYKALGGGA